MTPTLTTEETHSDVAPVERTLGGITFSPRFDIWENDDETILYGDLPGVMPRDLDVSFEKPVLTIYGKVSPRHDDITVPARRIRNRRFSPYVHHRRSDRHGKDLRRIQERCPDRAFAEGREGETA